MKADREMLAMALAGYQIRARQVEAEIEKIRRRIGAARTARAPEKAHRISAEGRARIAEAQRKRWAAAKKGTQANP
jgi:hypothetical protein